MSTTVPALFDNYFVESYAGTSLLKDTKVALMELIANSWDAAATDVQIVYPTDADPTFKLSDNGHGMTEKHFQRRFMTFGYRRSEEQGIYAQVPDDLEIGQRRAFGKNAKGKFAAFRFGDTFIVRTWREGSGNEYLVERSNKAGLSSRKLKSFQTAGHGTEIVIEKAFLPEMPADAMRSEIGMRFLSDPSFSVRLNGMRVTFDDVPYANLTSTFIEIDGIGQIKITIIDTNSTDKTTHHHGVAWWVDKRLVGECSWKDTEFSRYFDGRRTPAKRYTFIVEADVLNQEGVILPDWTAFYPNNEVYKVANDKVSEFIRDYVLEVTKANREKVFDEIKGKNQATLREMSLNGRGKWEDFIKEVQEECPSITDDDLDRLSGILASLEVADSKYGLLEQLSKLDAENLDELNNILKKWDIDFAKIVLDELEARLKLLEKLQVKLKSKQTDEVHELQPLFHRGLWIFGPEYETIEYTSNQGMTRVIQDLFVSDKEGSLQRPDFVILPDGSVGVYSYARFSDENGEEMGPACVTIVELKRPGVTIGKTEKAQPLDRAVELREKGLIKDYTQVRCFVLGEFLDPKYAEPSEDWNGRLKTFAFDYSTVISKAKSRTLKLYDRVKHAPFLKETRVEQFIIERDANVSLFNDLD
jgi:hypothetical protein